MSSHKDDNNNEYSGQYREKASKLLEKMLDKTNDIAETYNGENKGIAAATAASLLNLGVERINKNESQDVEGSLPYSESELKDLRSLATDMDKDRSHHFVDGLLERLIKHSVPSEDKEVLEKRLNDPARTNKPNLSLKILFSNFKTLSSKMSGLFAFQYGFLHLVTWRNPSKTLLYLILYTCICIWPHLVLALPLVGILGGVFIEGYAYRHPMEVPELIPVKKRGQSLLDFLSSDDSSVLDDFISKDLRDLVHSKLVDLEESSNSSQDASNSAKLGTLSQELDINESIKRKNKSEQINSQMTLLMNMRDLQNLTTELINSINAAEVFFYETAGFKDEKLSTFFFYILSFATGVVLFFGRFIPWRLIFIQSGWIALIVCHPRFKQFLQTLTKNKKKSPKKAPKVNKTVKKFERDDIIVDIIPDVSVVEIYELHIKSLLNNTWSFHLYTNNMFDLKDPTRVAGGRPTGASKLSNVMPPPEWRFDSGYTNKWKADKQPKNFLRERSVDTLNLIINENETEGWIYDNMEHSEDTDYVYEFRRRRLTRECYRYARPLRKPNST